MPRGGRVVSGPSEGAFHSLAIKGGKPSASKNEQARRGSVEWYRQWIEYFYEKRERVESFWAAVDEKYRNTKWEDSSDDKLTFSNFGLGRVPSETHLTEATVMTSRPEIQIKGFTGKITQELVPTAQQALNNEWYTIPRLVRETRLCVRDCKKYGLAFSMTTYDQVDDTPTPEPGEGKELDPTLDAQADVLSEQLAQQEAEMPNPEPLENFEADSRIVYNRANTRHISLWDMLVDPDAKNPEDVRIVGRRIIADLDMVKADKSLTNTRDLKASDISDIDQRHVNDEKKRHSPYRFIELFELWERQPGGRWKKVLLARNGGGFLKPAKEDPSWMGHPFSALRWNEDGKTIFPQSDFLAQWGLMLAEETVANKALDGHLREQYDLTFVPRGMLSEENFQEIMGNGEIGYYVEYDEGAVPGDADLRRKMFRPDVKPRSPETLNFLGMMARQLQQISGNGNNQLGSANKSGTTATEAAEIAGFARVRGSYKFAAVDEFVADIAHRRLAIMAQFYSKADIIRLVGETGQAWPAGQFSRGDVKQGIHVIVVPGSMRPVNDDIRASYLMQLLQAFSQHPVLLARLGLDEWATRFARTQGIQDGDALVAPMSQEDHAKLVAQLAAAQSGGAGGGGSAAGQGSPPGVSAPATSAGGVTQVAQG